MKKTGITVEVTQELLNNGFTHATPVADAQTMRNRAYSTDRAAPEMDVEAERHLYEEALSYLMKNGLLESGFDLWLAARSAAHGTQPETAPVSTEQAGDARHG